MEKNSRRTFLKTTAGVSGAVALGGTAIPGCVVATDNDPEFGQIVQGATAEYDNTIFNHYFYVEVKGMYDKLPGVSSFDPGKVTCNIEPADRGDKAEYTVWAHGDHEYEDATITVMQAPGMVKLQKWADKAMKMGGAGDALRRDISCYLLARDKSTVVKTINLFGCYPVDFDAGDQGAGGSELKTMTISLNVDRIEVA